MMNKLILIAAGGALGSMARYGLGLAVQVGVPSAFPWGTVAINLLGCFLFGVVAGLIERGNVLPEGSEMLLLVGFMGAFTTFSTFAFHNTSMIFDGKLGWLAANIILQNAAGILLLFGGLMLARPR